MNARRIPVILSVDVEPDGFFIDRDKPIPWDGAEASFAFFQGLRQRVAGVTGSPARFSWFLRMDPQVEETYGSAAWAAANYASQLRECLAQGDEIGLHVHAYRWDDGRKTWVIDHGNPEWVARCIRVSFGAFREAFGRDCASLRMGDRWMSGEALALARSLGARFDLTLEPGKPTQPSYHLDKPYTGSLPDYRGVPAAPYHPSPSDYRRPDPDAREGLWMIPQSCAAVDALGPLRKLFSRLTGPGRLAAPGSQTLNLERPPAFFRLQADTVLARLGNPHLAIVLRSDLFTRPKGVRNLQRNLDFLLSRPETRDFRFATPEECMDLLEPR
jgi:hypothetical protein